MTENPVKPSDPLAERLSARATRTDIATDGGHITWRTWGRSGGPHVVLLHGSAGSWTHWLRNIEPLSATHTVHVPDLPGSGDSSPFAHAPSFVTMAGAMLASLDGLLPERPRINLVGFSFGSLLAEEMALLRPEQVDRLVLVRGSFDGKVPTGPKGLIRWRDIVDPLERREAHRRNLATLMIHDTALIDDVAVDLHAHNSARSTLNPIPYGATLTPGALAALKVPVHGITGEFDPFGGGDVPAQGRALLAAQPDATFLMIRGAGHWVSHEAAETFNAELRSVLDRHVRAA